MARKERNNVDYFPHSVSHGKKMFYLRDKYKNDGYAVWFMLLEELGKADYHFLDLQDDIQLMYLSSEFKVSELLLNEIISTLVKFGEFDSELWNDEKIIFNLKFIENISDAYKKRNNDVIDKYSLVDLLVAKGRIKPSKSNPKPSKSKTKAPVNTQTILEDSKVKESKVNEINNIYSVYPSKCPIKGNSTGKGQNDKDKIKKLLLSISEDKLIKTIEWYIADCKQSKTYIKNFSTFLNNIPDMAESKPSQETKTHLFKCTFEGRYPFKIKAIDEDGAKERYMKDNGIYPDKIIKL